MFHNAPMKAFVLAFVTFVFAASAAEPLPAQRIVFLGDSITYGGQYVVDFSCWLAVEHSSVKVLNLGLGSETVSGLSEEGHAGGKFPRPSIHERLERVLRATRPDLVIACYGMNCGIYLPFDEGRFSKFRDGMTRLHNEVIRSGANIIHLTPPVYDSHGEQPSYDEVLERYSAWLLQQRAKGWQVIDVHGWMKQRLMERRRKDPSFTFSRDRIHPNKEGHRVIAQPLLAYFGGTEAPADTVELRKLVEKRMILLRDAWLTATGHKRPGVASGLPLSEAEKQAAELTKQIAALLGR